MTVLVKHFGGLISYTLKSCLSRRTFLYSILNLRSDRDILEVLDFLFAVIFDAVVFWTRSD